MIDAFIQLAWITVMVILATGGLYLLWSATVEAWDEWRRGQ